MLICMVLLILLRTQPNQLKKKHIGGFIYPPSCHTIFIRGPLLGSPNLVVPPGEDERLVCSRVRPLQQSGGQFPCRCHVVD